MSVQSKLQMLKINLYEIIPTILPVLANLELLKKFLEKIIANLPDANPTESIDTNEYPYSTKVNNKPSLISKPKTNETTPYVPKRLS